MSDFTSYAADDMQYNSEKGIMSLKGNVQVVLNGQHLSADKVTIYSKKKIVEAEDNVSLRSTKVYAEADRLQFNYENDTGFFYNSFIQSGQVVFEGSLIEKVGPDEYIATKAQYTPCDTCPPAWSFSGSEIKAEVGGYANIKYPVFRIAGWPVLILPRLIIPLKSKRQTGLLSPSFETSDNSGTSLGLHYFWAISQSQDLTTSLINYDKRGLKGLFEYRYVLDQKSKGKLRFAHINDKGFQQDHGAPQAPTIVDRGFVTYEHYYEMPNNYIQRADIRYVSDLRYIRDFSEEVQVVGEPSVESRASITKNTELNNFSVEVGFNNNLLQEDAFADNIDAVHRFPEIRHYLREQRAFNTGFLVKAETSYNNFIRTGYGYDDICEPGVRDGEDGPTLKATSTCNGGDIVDLQESSFLNYTQKKGLTIKGRDSQRDGIFDPENDLIRSGQRIDFKPTVSYPIKIGHYVDILPSVTYRETQYRFTPLADSTVVDTTYTPSAARRYVQTDLSLRTSLAKIYGNKAKERETLYKHEIEPELVYSGIPFVRQPNHPFFADLEDETISYGQDIVVEDDDFFGANGLQFDYNDRLLDRRSISYVINNRITKKEWVGDSPRYREIALFRLTQGYDFKAFDRDPENPKPWSAIEALTKIKLKSFEAYTEFTYFPYATATNSKVRLRLINQRRDFVELNYFQTFTIDENDDFTFAGRRESIGLGVGFASRYVTLDGGLQYSNVDFKIQSWRYRLILRPPGDCWNIRYEQWQPAASSEVIKKINFEFEFGG